MMSEPHPPRPAPSPPLKVLVLGAGWLGWPLAEAFAADGALVTTVRRSPHDAVTGGRALAVDLAALGRTSGASVEPPALAAQFGDQDVVVAAVAPDRARGDSHESIYPGAARATMAIAAAVGARAVAWVSSTGVYGYQDGEEVTESTPRAGHGPAFAALAAAEDTVLAASAGEPYVVVLRVAGLYGPGRDPAPRFRDAAALAGRFGHWLNLAWRDDVIDAIRCWTAAALRGEDPPRVLNVADGAPVTVAEAARLVAQAEGRVFAPPATSTASAAPGLPPAPSGRSNQRIRVYALRSMGWTPAVPHLRVGLQRLGYERLRLDGARFGPQSGLVRALLRDLAQLSPEAHASVCDHWESTRDSASLAQADRVLGETMVRLHRESERDAAAGPLLQMLRPTEPPAVPPVAGASASDGGEARLSQPAAPDTETADLDRIAEPALAALMAVVVRDGLAEAAYRTLTASLAVAIPWLHDTRTTNA